MRLRALRNSLHSEGIHRRAAPALSRAVHEVSVDVGMRAGRSEEWHKTLTILSRNLLPRLCKVSLSSTMSLQSGYPHHMWRSRWLAGCQPAGHCC